MSDKIIVVGDKDAKRKKMMVVGANDAQPMLEILKLYMSELMIIKYSFEDELLRIKGCPPIHETTIDEFKKIGFSAPGNNMMPTDIVDLMKIFTGGIEIIPEIWNDFSHGNGYFSEIDNLFNDIGLIFRDIRVIISTNPEFSKQLSVPFSELQKVHLAAIEASSDYGEARKRVQKLIND
jgi:hypothetical protein